MKIKVVKGLSECLKNKVIWNNWIKVGKLFF
jgi:hypothetical protein